RHPGPAGITCHTGCSDCCQRRFSVTAIEAEVVAGALAALPASTREAMAARALAGGDACPALEVGDDGGVPDHAELRTASSSAPHTPGGRCAIYEVRPLVCRSHGLPIRFTEDGRRSLPLVDVCPRNFVGQGTLPADAVLDQTTLSTVLGALDAARAD